MTNLENKIQDMPCVVSIEIKSNSNAHLINFKELCDLGMLKYSKKHGVEIIDSGGLPINGKLIVSSIYINKPSITREEREISITNCVSKLFLLDNEIDFEVFNHGKSLRKDFPDSKLKINEFSLLISENKTVYVHFFSFN